MTHSLRVLLAGLVDYAGLFPPASLELAVAAENYGRHRADAAGWLLGRFIAPAERLAELATTPYGPRSGGEPWPLSALVGSREGGAAAVSALATQAQAIAEFETVCAARARVTTLEAPLTADLTEPARLTESLIAADLGGREVFLELPAQAAVAATMEEIAAAARASGTSFVRLGAKLRCGGMTADAFPTCERIAIVLATGGRLGLPLKFTAGLHHPVRHRATTPAVMMHGFLNVFTAGLLAYGAETDTATLAACLAETDPAAFAADDDGFGWREHRVDVPTIERLRAQVLCGFGSCSYVEPRDDLRALGLLPDPE